MEEAKAASQILAALMAQDEETKGLEKKLLENEDIEKVQFARYKECQRIEKQMKEQLLSRKTEAVCLVENEEELQTLINVAATKGICFEVIIAGSVRGRDRSDLEIKARQAGFKV